MGAYKSPKSMRAAITRDLCHKKAPKKIINTSAYLRARGGPMRFDYPGFDDGTMCPKGRKVHSYKKRAMPKKAVAALKKFRSSGRKRVYRKLSKSKSPHAKHALKKKSAKKSPKKSPKKVAKKSPKKAAKKSPKKSPKKVAKKSPAKRKVAKKSPAKKVAKKSPAKRKVVKKSPAKKVAPRRSARLAKKQQGGRQQNQQRQQRQQNQQRQQQNQQQRQQRQQ